MIGFAHGTNLQQLTFLGLMGILDPPRPGVENSVHTLLRSGVQVKMVTGDSKHTALTIGNVYVFCQRIGLYVQVHVLVHVCACSWP